jgi:predicted Zn-dependent protease
MTPALLAGNPFIQERFATTLQVRAQFARDVADVLAIPQPDARLPDMRQIWWALRAEALGRAGQKAAAMREIKAMRQARGRHPVANDLKPMVKVAELIALARIAEGSGDSKGALRQLHRAAGIERTFTYNEPPTWHQPIDSALGALLLRTGDARGAKAAFDRALVRRPGNAWALWGRAQAEAALGDTRASAQSMTQYRKSWAGGPDGVALAQL